MSIRTWISSGLAFALGLAAAAGRAQSDSVDEDAVRPPACKPEVEIAALVYVVEDPARSMALVGPKGDRLVRIGSWIDERQVLDMGPQTLILGPIEDPCTARLTERSTRGSGKSRKRRRRRRRRR